MIIYMHTNLLRPSGLECIANAGFTPIYVGYICFVIWTLYIDKYKYRFEAHRKNDYEWVFLVICDTVI